VNQAAGVQLVAVNAAAVQLANAWCMYSTILSSSQKVGTLHCSHKHFSTAGCNVCSDVLQRNTRELDELSRLLKFAMDPKTMSLQCNWSNTWESLQLLCTWTGPQDLTQWDLLAWRVAVL
jgi:hypothetical protein